MVYKNINDYHLVEMVCENDDASYGVLFDKYSPLIKKIASKYYKNNNNYGYDYEDFVQEGYVAVYKALKYFNSSKDVLFYTFVSLCINRHMLSFIKKISVNHSNYVFVSGDEYDFDLLFSSNDNYTCNYYLDNLLKEVIYESPLDYSCVFELKLNNFSFKEIQELLGMSYSQAEYRYRKLKLLLKEKIENYLNKKAL